MKIYFAGVPAGLQRDREEKLQEVEGIDNRLVTFFYTKKALITLKHFAGVDVDYTNVKDYE